MARGVLLNHNLIPLRQTPCHRNPVQHEKSENLKFENDLLYVNSCVEETLPCYGNICLILFDQEFSHVTQLYIVIKDVVFSSASSFCEMWIQGTSVHLEIAISSSRSMTLFIEHHFFTAVFALTDQFSACCVPKVALFSSVSTAA